MIKTMFGHVALDDLVGDLERLSVDIPGSLGRPLLPPFEEQIQPHLWRWQDIRALLEKMKRFGLAGEGRKGLERRMLRLAPHEVRVLRRHAPAGHPGRHPHRVARRGPLSARLSPPPAAPPPGAGRTA
jgi:hypothetical protein